MSKEIDQNQREIREISGFQIEVLITETEIRKRLVEVADKIYQDYYEKDKNPLLICVLKGAEPTYTWLSQELGRGNPKTNRKPVSVCGGHIGLSSYGKEEKSSGELEISSPLSIDIKDEHILIVEDIVDSGNTISKSKIIFSQENPKTLKYFALLDKEENRKIPVEVNYTGFKIPNKFVVGFGLDCDGNELRNLPYIGIILKKP